MDDLSISNNHDTRKILTTVARTVIDFMEHHPKAIIMATGSTISRTRLYQINISHFLDEIEGIFEIWGFTGLKWELYKKGNNFESFFIIKK